MPLDAPLKPTNVCVWISTEVPTSVGKSPLYPQERTLARPSSMSASDPERTFGGSHHWYSITVCIREIDVVII